MNLKIPKFTIIGILTVVLVIAIGGIAVRNFVAVKAVNNFKDHKCSVNQREIMQSIMLYAVENDYIMPGKNVWSLVSVSEKYLKCPDDPEEEKTNSYAYSAGLFSLDIGDENKLTKESAKILVALSDSSALDNIMSDYDDFSYRHTYKEANYAIVVFLDGHIGVVKDGEHSVLFALPDMNLQSVK